MGDPLAMSLDDATVATFAIASNIAIDDVAKTVIAAANANTNVAVTLSYNYYSNL